VTTFKLRAVCPRCNGDLVAVTEAALCEDPEAQALCVGCDIYFCVKVTVERCGIGPLGAFDVDKALERAGEAFDGYNPITGRSRVC